MKNPSGNKLENTFGPPSRILLFSLIKRNEHSLNKQAEANASFTTKMRVSYDKQNPPYFKTRMRENDCINRTQTPDNIKQSINEGKSLHDFQNRCLLWILNGSSPS